LVYSKENPINNKIVNIINQAINPSLELVKKQNELMKKEIKEFQNQKKAFFEQYGYKEKFFWVVILISPFISLIGLFLAMFFI
jgi:hypothetical protein